MNCYVRAVFRAASRNRRCLLHRPDRFRESLARCYAASSITGERLIYDVMGDPSHVLRCEKYEVVQPKGKEVLVETMAAPINPADINTIQGVYAVKPPLPAVPGSEAVGRVVAVGPSATESSPDKLKPGDIVITRQTGMGVWSSHVLSDAQSFYKLPTSEVSSDEQLATVATLSVNPCTAYRMLVDFEKLSPGDVVVQNGANSAVGQAVIQIAKSMGLKTLNIVRDRSDFDSLKSFLTELGADWVCRDNDEAGIKALGLHRKVKLGLNCVAGKSGIQMMKLLAPESNIVLYGGMSRQPLVVPVSFLIFSDIRVRGFWMTAWKAANEKKRATSRDFEEMMDHLWGLVKDGHLRPPKHRFVTLGDYRSAVKDAMPEGGRGNDKIIFKFQ